MNERELRVRLIALITYLMNERPDTMDNEQVSLETLGEMVIPSLWTMFRSLVNLREPKAGHPRFYETQDEVLSYFINKDHIATIEDATLSPDNDRIGLWRGDITRLKVDAIVNAASKELQGCWVPGHNCIDNAIHTFAGVQLREECAHIIEAQGHEEPVGKARTTSAYNLPCTHIIHTVGPIANGKPTDRDRTDLASCYSSCLEAARSVHAKTLAFCPISTGVFGFSQEEAADIAYRTVADWLGAHPTTDITVIFNTFDADCDTAYRLVLNLPKGEE